MYLCRSEGRFILNGYTINNHELVEVEFINIEVGKSTMITFKDRFGSRFTLDAKTFYYYFVTDTIL